MSNLTLRQGFAPQAMTEEIQFSDMLAKSQIGHDPKTGTAQLGMTLRDYFAAKAMQGMIAEPSLKATPEEFAQRAYMVADEMMKARDA